ncbi:MAG: hypothetical protein KC620_14985, partial [Myxococcales bacterium]|nr:hypothetical protein [Myxococcales bacterium]
VVYIAFRPRPDQIAPGEIALDPTFECALYLFDAPTGRSTFLASCPAGTLTFTEAATSPGAPVRGRFDVELWATNWSR